MGEVLPDFAGICLFNFAILNIISRLIDKQNVPAFLVSASHLRPSTQKSSQILDVHLPLFAEIC
jgi:hypothetical protein